VSTPAWWIEGAAIIFPNIWLKNNWQDFSAFRGLSFSEVDVEGMDLDRWYGDTIRKAQSVIVIMGCFLGMSNAYLAYLTSYQTVWVDIPMDIYELGFEN
jgi:hypothetical protein